MHFFFSWYIYVTLSYHECFKCSFLWGRSPCYLRKTLHWNVIPTIFHKDHIPQPRVYWVRHFFPSPSSNPAQAYFKTWFLSEPKPGLALKAHFIPSQSRAQLGYPTCFWAWHEPVSDFLFVTEPRQASSDFLAQAGSSFSKLPTLCHW